MSLKNLNKYSASTDWDKKWVDIFEHYQNDIRHAHYMRAILEKDERSVLELAAGSFRDMAELRRHGVDCKGMDFSNESITLAKRQFPEIASEIYHASAFNMPFRDRQFDVTYHNGFWVLFPDDQIKLLAEEQARITKKRMVVTVHNAHNRSFVKYFENKKKDDPLYDVRFFHKDEVIALMSDVCRDVSIIPVGKGKRRHEDWLIKHGVISPKIISPYLKLSGHRLIEQSERLLCIGTLK